MSIQLDLLEWAASRPTAKIIDARELFERRTVDLAIALHFGRVPRRNGVVASIDAARAKRNADPVASLPSPARAGGPAA